MQRYQEKIICKHSIEQVFEIVTDIESYPKFLPWCSNAAIIDKTENEILAELEISFKGITESYTSRVTVFPPQNGHCEVRAEMISGPFRHLDSIWRVTKIEDGSFIEFNLDFAFKSSFLEKIMGLVFKGASKKMIKAFEERADNLFA